MLEPMRIGRNQLYQKDVIIVTRYRENYLKLVLHRSLRKSGYEAVDGDNDKKGKKNTAGNSDKLENSISRTKSKIFELAMCNNWEYVIHMTFDKEKIDRYDLNLIKQKLLKWINNYNQNNNTNIKYLLIPEQHKDSAWHIHGLIMNIPKEHLKEFKENDVIPIKIKSKIAQGEKVFDWDKYSNKFGFVLIEEIRNAEAISKYITKYITKDLKKTTIKLNEKMYYCSKNLRRKELIHKGLLKKEFKPDYENFYVKIKVFNSLEEIIEFLDL